MGEIAEMMLDGTLCSQCGVFMGNESGFSRVCRGCSSSNYKRQQFKIPKNEPNPFKMNCEICKRRVRISGMPDHLRDSHGIKKKEADHE